MDEQEQADAPGSSSPIPFTLAELAVIVRHRAASGWVWDEEHHRLNHPTDPQLYFAFDTTNHKLFISDTLLAHLREECDSPEEEEQP